MSNRGLGSAVANALKALPPSTLVTISDAEKIAKVNGFDATRMAVSNALTYLATLKLLEPGELRGTYRTPRLNVEQPDDEAIVIDNLLAAMAAAEPVLRKYKPLIDLARKLR
jgi:hypothetical protein